MSVKEKQKKAFDVMKSDWDYTNLFEAPRLEKVVISTGTGSSQDRGRNDLVMDRLAKITGQKPAPRKAKQSIASFKLREGDPIGAKVTLRGQAMYRFLDKLFNVALPRTKDFRGLEVSAIDEMGNYTIGIREHTVFTESADEEIRDVFGLSVTLVTTAKNKEESEPFLRHIGVPLKSDEE